MACSVSGTGEAIIRTCFARSLAEALCAAPPEETHEVIKSKFEAFIGLYKDFSDFLIIDFSSILNV